MSLDDVGCLCCIYVPAIPDVLDGSLISVIGIYIIFSFFKYIFRRFKMRTMKFFLKKIKRISKSFDYEG